MEPNGEWRRLYNEKLHSLYRSPNIVKMVKSRVHVVGMEILKGKLTGKRRFRKVRRRWEDNIRMDLK